MRGGGAGGGNQPMSQGMSRAMAGGSHMGQGGHLGQQDDNEIARLEHENTQLRWVGGCMFCCWEVWVDE